MWIAPLFLFVVACPKPPVPPPPPGNTGPEALAGFDNLSNGAVAESTHAADLETFDETEDIGDGLGPLYNAQACRECHQNTVSGGASQVSELRVGHAGPDGKFVSPDLPIGRGTTVIQARTLVNDRAICPNAQFPDSEIQERVPDSEKIRTFRISLSVLGDGFVEAVDDTTLVGLAREQCRASQGKICGQALYVPIIEAPGTTRVGRFGWKDQHASLLSFSADAYLNEMGITSRLQPDEVTAICNSAAEPNDSGAFSDIDRFARFMRATKAPARDTIQAKTTLAVLGSRLFDSIGCATCHVRTLTTAPAGTVINGGLDTIPAAMGSKTFHPFGDFLLHNVGTGDGIVMTMQEHYGKKALQILWRNYSRSDFGNTQNKMRTAALWGVRLRPRLMHDAASLTLRDAIVRHRGEASGVTDRFLRLSGSEQTAIVEFLKSL
ncbi:MAG TPA: di-heme oxidoredictase family protein [Gemmatimonadales bacterium]|nr:di-heme oxidoredictase family protein [Gemmatimonadales bacterium]